MTPLSILELVRVTQETDARGALNNARDLAAHAEKLGYERVWVAEHHNMAGIASAATSAPVCTIRSIATRRSNSLARVRLESRSKCAGR